MLIKAYHRRATTSYSHLLKAAVTGAFAVLTVCGVTLPYLGFDYGTHVQYGAAGIGGLIGLALALRA